MPAPPDPPRTAPPGGIAPTATRDPDIGLAADAPDAPAGAGGPVPPARTPPPPSERYVFREEIAAGGMGVVYAATDTVLGREVAVKLLHGTYAPASGAAGRFADEARIAGQLQHPNIPAVHDLGTLPDGRPFLAMKLIKGSTLAALLDRRPDPGHDRGRFLASFEKVCEAVAYAHAHNVIHRDLKPANVMVGAFGEVQVMDWGLAKVLGPRSDGRAGAAETAAGTAVVSLRDTDDLLTAAGSVLGTPAYMPPEQAVGAVDAVDARSDVFGLGAVLAVVLTGRPPFVSGASESTRVMAARADLAGCYERLGACGADPEWVALCKRCLAPRPEDRPADAGEVAAAVAGLRVAAEERARRAELDRVKAEGEVRTRRVAEEKAAERRKRRRVQFALAGALLLVAALAAAGTGVASLWRAAEAAKGEAERQRDAADAARAGEADARREVERERERLARVNYGRVVQVAYQYWRDNKVADARFVLAGTRPDLRGWEYDYVHRLCHSDLVTLRGHAGGVFCAAYSANGSRVLTASLDGTARVWDAATGRPLVQLTGHTHQVLSAAFSADGAKVVTGSRDKTARVWDAATGKRLVQLTGHAGSVRSAAFSADGGRVLTAGEDGTARIWDAATGKSLADSKWHAGGVLSAAFSADGSRMVTGSVDMTARVWDPATGEPLVDLTGHASVVYSAAFSADGAKVVTGSLDGTAWVWDPATGKPVVQLTGHAGEVSSAAFSADGSRVLTASLDGTARVWDAATGERLVQLTGHTGAVRSAAFSADGSRVVTAGEDKTARVWDPATGEPLVQLTGHTGEVSSAAFSADGSRVLTYSGDNTARIWDAASGAELLALPGHLRAALSSDGTRILTLTGDMASESGPLLIYDSRPVNRAFARAARGTPAGAR